MKARRGRRVGRGDGRKGAERRCEVRIVAANIGNFFQRSILETSDRARDETYEPTNSTALE